VAETHVREEPAEPEIHVVENPGADAQEIES